MLHWSESVPIKPVCCLHGSPRATAKVARFLLLTFFKKVYNFSLKNKYIKYNDIGVKSGLHEH